MKKNIFFLLLIPIFVLPVFISCKSTQKVEDGQPGTHGWVTAARQRAIDFESPNYFPSDWENLETQYSAMTINSHKEEDYNALAESYDALFKKSVPLYAQVKEDELMAAREPVVSSGFGRYFPKYLKNVDDKTLAAQDQYNAGDYYKAKDTAAEALAGYEELHLGVKVFLARQEVIDRGFTQYDAENFAKADEISNEAINAFDSGNKTTAADKAEEAFLRYNIVLSNGWIAYASERKSATSKERELAIAEKANIAARDTFRNADAIYAQSGELFLAEDYENAAISFTEAEAVFAISRIETEEKRVRAEEAIRNAEEVIGVSNETAVEAERIIEGGAR